MRAGFVILVLGLLLAGDALAQSVFRWTDDEGQVHYGHAVPQQYRALGYERLAPDGRVLERVAPAMTPEERAEESARLALQAELLAEQESQAARDRLLLAAYRSEQDLIDTRDGRILAMQHQRRTIETSYNHAVQRFEDLIARAASFRRNSEPVPETITSSIRSTQAEVRRLRDALAEMDARMESVYEHFDVDLARFRSLTGRSD
ncbi:MAG: DUF4124 domain-containing protein [Wenzhouxiangella sp.]|nr:MAG: DUF4124 domain-containing protein [Wenzhouxiangella sp.]